MGKRKNNIDKAISMLSKSSEIRLTSKSEIYKSKAMYNAKMNDFFNLVIRIETNFSPLELLDCIKKIETKLGRIRNLKERYSPRTIDIDILCYGNKVIESKELTIPHPHIEERKFVLKPWSDIDSDYIIANRKKKILDLLRDSKDNSKISRVRA